MTSPTPPLFECKDVGGFLVCRSTLDSTQYGYKLAQGGRYGMDVAVDEMGIDEKRMALRFQFANGVRRDGVGDLLEISGIDTSRHIKNPIVGLDHMKHVRLPIGMAEDPETKQYTVELDPISKQAWLTCFFYRGKGLPNVKPAEEYDHALLCEQVFDMAAKRFLRAGSIGYQVVRAARLPANYETGTPQGLHLLQTLMLEGSLVVLPANGDTVRKALNLPTCCGKPLSPVLVKSLAPYAPERKAVLGWESKSCGCSGGECHCAPAEETTMQAAGEGKKAAPKVDVKALRQKYKALRLGTAPSSKRLPPKRDVKSLRAKYRKALDPAPYFQPVDAANAAIRKLGLRDVGTRGGETTYSNRQEALRAVNVYTDYGVPAYLVGDAIVKVGKSLGKKGTFTPKTEQKPPTQPVPRIETTYDYGKRKGLRGKYAAKSLSVRPRAKLIKGYTDLDVAFDTSHMTSAKQMDFHKAMESAGFGKPVGGKWGEDGKTLLSPLKKSRFKACLGPEQNPAKMLSKAAALAAQYGAKLLSTK